MVVLPPVWVLERPFLVWFGVLVRSSGSESERSVAGYHDEGSRGCMIKG